MERPKLWFVFDVESIGLHGEGFAVGYQVVDAKGVQFARRRYACPPEAAAGGADGRIWVAQNCPPIEPSFQTPREVRDAFWHDWLIWKQHGAVLVADCQWPVEARFLIACIDDAPDERGWSGPYPMHELASFMVAAGLDPMATYDRDETEVQHDPLGDARQSARLLVMALDRLAASTAMLLDALTWAVEWMERYDGEVYLEHLYPTSRFADVADRYGFVLSPDAPKTPGTTPEGAR